MDKEQDVDIHIVFYGKMIKQADRFGYSGEQCTKTEEVARNCISGCYKVGASRRVLIEVC